MANIERLPADGERYLPGMGGRIAAEHLARYSFAEQFIVDKNVLDVASGEGYGTAIMAARAHSITGVDLAEAAVLFAQEKYSKVSNAKFQVGDVTALPFAASSFDVVTCYETIEHVDEPLKAILEAKRVLNDSGLLIVSTPNAENYSDRFQFENPFHKKELRFGEFKSRLQKVFKHVKFFGQFSSAASCIFHTPENGRWLIPDQELAVTHANVTNWTSGASSGNADPLYFIAVCSDYPLLDDVGPIEFFDASDWRCVEDEFALRRLGAQLQSRNDTVAALRRESEASQVKLQASNDTVTALRRESEASQVKLQASNDTVTALRRESEASQANLQASNDILNRRDVEIQTLRRAFNSLRGQHTRLNKEIEGLNKEIEAMTAELNAIVNSTTWRLGSTLRNKLMRSSFLRKVTRKVYLSLATKR